MNLSSISDAKIQLKNLMAEDLYQEKEALEHANLLLNLVERFPALEKDEETCSLLCKITEGLFSIKEHLPEDKQGRIVQLFRSVHHIKPTYIHKLMDNTDPASTLAEQHKDIEAVLRGKQEYPVPLRLLVGEKMPCKTYFKSLSVELNDGSSVKVCQGLLAHFSEMVQALIREDSMAAPVNLVLDQLNRHQFDTLVAYLETLQPALINKENALPLLFAAAYLQIPELIEAAAAYLYLFLDDDNVIELLNLVPKHLRKGLLVLEIEKYLSLRIKQGLLTMNSEELKRRLKHFRERLDHPVSLDLSESDITDDQLKEIVNFPIKELNLSNCQGLTKKALQIVAKNNSIKKLILDGNNWVDDKVLKEIPSNIESLSVSTCQSFTRKGLEELKGTAVKELSVVGCKHLKDDDFTGLPSLTSLDAAYCEGFGEGAFKRLGQMESLKQLALSDVTKAAAHTHLMPKTLVNLDLSGCPVDDASMDAISEMKNLQVIRLNGAKITDKGLKKLPPSVSTISLNGCPHITDAGVAELAKRSNLKSVFLRRCPKVTKNPAEIFPENVTVGWDEAQVSRLARKAAEHL